MGQSIAAQILPFEFIYAHALCTCPNPVRVKDVTKSVPEMLLANGYQTCPVHTSAFTKKCDATYIRFCMKEKTYYMPEVEYQEGETYEFDTGTQIIIYDIPQSNKIQNSSCKTN